MQGSDIFSNADNIGLIGDVHMRTEPLISRAFPYFDHMGIKVLVQVGDFLMYPKFMVTDGHNPNALDDANDELHRRGMVLVFVRGNHDSKRLIEHYTSTDSDPFVKIRSNIFYATDGARVIVNGVEILFVGGAISVDDDKREQQIRRMYCPDEGISIADLDRAMARNTDVKYSDARHADVMISHDGLPDLNWQQLHDDAGREYERFDIHSVYNRALLGEIAAATGVTHQIGGHFHFPFHAQTSSGVMSYGLGNDMKPGLLAVLNTASGTPIVAQITDETLSLD